MDTRPVALTPRALRVALDETYAKVEDPRMIVGQWIGDVARIWAEEKGLEVRQTNFAPPNRLFIVGAVPVEGVFIP